MTLPKSCVIRTDDGRYLSATGALVFERAGAVVLLVSDAGKLMPVTRRRRFGTPSLSMEELSKRERRARPPASPQEVHQTVLQMRLRALRADEVSRLQDLRRAEAALTAIRLDIANIKHAIQVATSELAR